MLQYAQYAGDFTLRWTWTPPGGSANEVPAWTLSRRRVPPLAATAVRVIDQAVFGLTVLMLGFTIGVAPVGLFLAGRALARAIDRSLGPHYQSRTALAMSLAAYAALLFVPQSGYQLWSSITSTARELHVASFESVRRIGAFSADLNTPRAGEPQAIPETALEVAALLERHGLQHYRLSPAIRDNGWALQQVIATAWPKTLEPDAEALFLWDEDRMPGGCTFIDRAKEVTLVRCP
jgi:hypothetical protein